MIHFLGNDAYRGFTAPFDTARKATGAGDCASFVGRIAWPGEPIPSAAVIKLYGKETCGTANELIGYFVNALRCVAQPQAAAVLLLTEQQVPPLILNAGEYLDSASGLVACWVTSYEQNATPYSFIRRLPTFTERQRHTFYQSTFCRALASVDCSTGNNDRHEGNYLYVDDLNYLAIDQGCVGGGHYWHRNWPEANPRNEIVQAAKQALTPVQLARWVGRAIIEHENCAQGVGGGLEGVRHLLPGLLSAEAIDTIVKYMQERTLGPHFNQVCGSLI